MQHYSILIGCDINYYNDWGINLLKSINYHNPWISLRCHIVNPVKCKKLSFVNYTEEKINFYNDTQRIAYLQAVRFLAASKVPKHENLITLDADTICTRSFSKEDFKTLFDKQYVMQHPKEPRWLAGLVTFGSNNFRLRYAELLNEKNVNNWEWGRDQQVMPQLAKEFNFVPVDKKWITIGKNKLDSAFLTLKGEQKETDKYLNIYKRYLQC